MFKTWLHPIGSLMHRLHPNPHKRIAHLIPLARSFSVVRSWLVGGGYKPTNALASLSFLPASPLMAPALTSNSFHVASSPRAKPGSKATKRLAIIHAKQAPFGLGKRKDASPGDGNQAKESTKRKPFFIDIDFGKLPESRSLVPFASSPSKSLFAGWRRKDPQTVFVAGATGQAGVRIAQTLLRQGYTVRAGVPELASAQELARLAATYKIISPEESRRLNAVESTFGNAESIAKAIGPAAKVVVTIGPAENGPSAEVTTDDALQVVRAAQLAGVGHVAVVYDSGSGFSGSSTYNVLDGITSFFSNLFSSSQPLTLGEFLSKVAETDVAYTLIKAALIDDYAAESSYALVVSTEGSTTNECKVPRSKIATLVADVFSNTSVSENKVVVVSTSPSASSKPIAELFSAIPEDGRRKAYAEELAKSRAEEEALVASEKAREAAEAAKELEEQVKKSEKEAPSSSLSEETRERAEAAGSSLESLLSKAKDFGGGFSWEKFSSQISGAVAQNTNDKPKMQIVTERGQSKARNLPSQKAFIKQPISKPRAKEPEQKTEVRKVFGGLFKQETIYMDED